MITRRQFFELAGLAVVAPGNEVSEVDVARRAADVIRGYDREGFHRTATPVDRASADRLMALARRAGGDPRLEPFELSRVDPGAASLEIDGRRLDGLPMFDGAFTDADGIRGRLGATGSDRPIAWVQVSPNAEAELQKTRTGSAHRALVVVTTGPNPGLCPLNAASFSKPFGPPVLQISSEHLALVGRAAAGEREVRVVASMRRRPATAFNVVVELRGAQPNLPPVCVMTPRSGWHANASERGGGLACWVETLRACSTARPLRSVKFLASSGHELGHLGLHAYLTHDSALAREALAWVHYGANIGASTGETRMTCSDDRLESVAMRALRAYQLEGLPRSPASRVGGEAATISGEGGRFISFIGSSAWFHHPRDRWPHAVDVEKVARFAQAGADLTLALANAPAE